MFAIFLALRSETQIPSRRAWQAHFKVIHSGRSFGQQKAFGMTGPKSSETPGGMAKTHRKFVELVALESAFTSSEMQSERQYCLVLKERK